MATMSGVKRTLLGLAAREAREYQTTIQQVLRTFALGEVRPEIAKDLETQLSALGVPPGDAIAQAETIFSSFEIEVEDLLIILQGYAGAMPTPIQGRELVSIMGRFYTNTRRHAKRMSQAQALAQPLLERDALENPPPTRPAQTFHRAAVRAAAIPGRGVSR
jgi:DNA-binding TFAR19-related protein (PDSD5 family)